MEKKNLISTLTLFLSILFFTQCTQNELLERTYPTIETPQVTSNTKEGVQLNATINNVNQYRIIEYGFIWGRSETGLNYLTGKKITVGNNLNDDNFSFLLSYGMVKDQTYKYRAYIKTDDKIVLSKENYFKSAGGKQTIVSQVNPNHGVVGDTIELIGENFSIKQDEITVKFDDIDSKVIENSTTSIKCIVPNNIVDSHNGNRIKLFIYGREIHNSFSIDKPKITSVNPRVGTYLDTLTIKGENFSIIKEENKVRFGDNWVTTAISSSKTELKVLVPLNVEGTNPEIRVITDKRVSNPHAFQMSPPTVYSISSVKDVLINDIVVLEGKNFHPTLSKNKVYFDSALGEVVSVSKNQLHAKVLDKQYDRRNVKVRYERVGGGITHQPANLEVNILDKWLMLKNINYKHIYNFAKVNNGQFMIGLDYYGKLSLLKLDGGYFHSTGFRIQNSNILNNEIKSIVSDENNLYVYNNSNSNFWKFNENTSDWTQKNNFPGTNRENLTHFTINNEVYMGFGRDSNTYYNDIYKYSLTTDSWTKIASLPNNSSRNITTTFVINNIAYMIGGATNATSKDNWAYNPQTDTWKKIADFPYAIDGQSSFVLNGEGYVTCGKIVNGNSINEVWKYNPINDSWIKSESIGTNVRYNHFSFILNNKAYVGGGIINNQQNQTNLSGIGFYEYTPN
jgi:N-acetylneuraminic acid mutarotase